MEFALLRSRLNRRIGPTGLPIRFVASLWAAAAVAAIAGWEMRSLMSGRNLYVAGVLVLGTYGAVYLAMSIVFGIPEAGAMIARVRRVTEGPRRG